jgi:hypothetical protein
MPVFQSTPGRTGNHRQPMLMRTGPLRRREPTAYLIARMGQQRRDPYASLRGMSRELAGMQMMRAGMGDYFTAAEIASSTVPVISSGAIAGGAAASLIPVAMIPFIGPIVAGVTFGLTKLFNRKAGGQKIAATQIVQEATAAMEENMRGFLEGPRTAASKAQALANFDAAWRYITEGCGNPELGDAGRRCIDERRRGSTVTCFINGVERSCDLFAAFRDPISAVQATSEPSVAQSLFGGGQASGQSLADGSGIGGNGLLWLIGGGALIYYAMSK